jgi:hypothetical protein
VPVGKLGVHHGSDDLSNLSARLAGVRRGRKEARCKREASAKEKKSTAKSITSSQTQVGLSKDIHRDHSARTNQNRGEKKKVTRTTPLRRPPTTQNQRVACRTRLRIALAGSDHTQRARARLQTAFFSSHVQNKHPHVHANGADSAAFPDETRRMLKPLLSCRGKCMNSREQR